VQHAGVILLDEPTAFLDAENKISVLQTLGSICRTEGSPAVIFSTHDLHEGMKVCNRVIALGADHVFRITGMDKAEEAVQGIFPKGNIFQK
jgi:ABC-type cobalamin/Fe3+-siderophores transport system ATPase subunit